MNLNTIKFNTAQGVALGTAVGLLMWAGIVGAILAVL